MAHSV